MALAGGGGSEPSTPSAPLPVGRVSALTPSVTRGIQAATSFAFSTQVVDFAAGALTYRWEFGDGASSTEPAPSHVYAAAGSYTVAVTVSDARQSARSETVVTVYSLTGRWVSTATGNLTLQLTQAGTAMSGTFSTNSSTGGVTFTNCPLSGSVRDQTPAVVLTRPVCRHPTLPQQLVQSEDPPRSRRRCPTHWRDRRTTALWHQPGDLSEAVSRPARSESSAAGDFRAKPVLGNDAVSVPWPRGVARLRRRGRRARSGRHQRPATSTHASGCGQRSADQQRAHARPGRRGGSGRP